jgi:adenosylmethionine-8-amino-7-oxononanoate aminotransferase
MVMHGIKDKPLDGFRKIRGTKRFNMWFNKLNENPMRNDYLKEIGQKIILPQFIPWKNPIMVTGAGGPNRVTSEGTLRDWGPIAYWTNIVPSKRSSACLFNVLHPPAVLLAVKLLQLSRMDMVAYGTTGSSANDIAIRIAMQYHKQLGGTNKQKIGCIRGSYHGSTGIDLYVSGDPARPALDDAKYLPSADWIIRLPDTVRKKDWFKKFDKIDLDKTAAIIYEPVQGVRGIRLLFEGLKHILPLAKKHGILTIADEISTAPAKTGRMFASEYLDKMPNLMTIGKAITNGEEVLSAVLIDQETADIVRTFTDFYYGHALSGHPEACQRALEVFEELESMNALGRVKRLGTFFLSKLKKMEKLSGVVEARGIGLMLALQVKDSRFAEQIRREMIRLGDLIGTEGNTIVIKPPFFIEISHIDNFCNNLKKSIEEAARKGKI